MMKYKNAMLTFTAVFLLSGFMAWLAGYNFDHRGLDVAVWLGYTGAFAYGIALVRGDFDKTS